MHRIQCAEIWGGIRNQEQDVCSAGIEASLYSSACDGGKGGDIYCLSVCESDMLTRIAIADVVGYGGAVTDVSQFVFDALKSHMNDASGASVLTEMNHITEGHGLKAMTTAAIIAFYRSDHNLYFAYADHHPALVKRQQDRNWFEAELEEPGDSGMTPHANLPLAVMSETVFTQQHVPLTAGDLVFLYTDGVIEAPDGQRDIFGLDRLTAVLDAEGSAPMKQLRTSVLDELNSHTGGDLSHDDVTLLAVGIRQQGRGIKHQDGDGRPWIPSPSSRSLRHSSSSV